MSNRITDVEKEIFVNELFKAHGAIVRRKDLIQFAESGGYAYPHWIFNNENLKAGRGQYNIGLLVNPTENKSTLRPKATKNSEEPEQEVATLFLKKLHQQVDNAVPDVDSKYVAFGFHKDLTTIIGSQIFYPVFISGLSGNGKTTMVEQVCAKLKREVFRVNISIETDEDSLIGGQTLVDGNVVYREGPALMAMRRGAILLLDEVDRGSNKLICLQAILEGKPFFNKRTGEMVYPAQGFNVIATANTHGLGSEDGRFAAAQILDEAFLERFAISYEQDYPGKAFELRIIKNNMKKLSIDNEEFAAKLSDWADLIRRSYKEGAVEDVISTRRLVHIVQAYSMFQDETKSIELCLTRYGEDSRNAFLKTWEALQNPTTNEESAQNEESNTEDILF